MMILCIFLETSLLGMTHKETGKNTLNGSGKVQLLLSLICPAHPYLVQWHSSASLIGDGGFGFHVSRPADLHSCPIVNVAGL